MHILELIHVPGLRNTPDRTYQVTAIAANIFNCFQFPGKFPNYVASIIDYWIRTHSERLATLERYLALLGLTNRIYTSRISDTQIELRVDLLLESSTNDSSVSLADVGLGVSQVLPVLTALLVAESGQLVYIEQPEIHLHPRAQVALAQVLSDAAKRGVRVVVETHSELLLLGIQTLVAEGTLPPEDVKLHWFRRQKEGITEITSATLDESGAFGDWPEDFGSISLDLQNRYLSAAEAHLWNSQNGK